MPAPDALPAPEGLLDVERFRGRPGRAVVVRRIESPVLVLGSSQRLSVVDEAAARRLGVTVARRRSGGGAVMVGHGDPLWVDLWVPRDDPLWLDDALAAAGWVGDHWAGVLAGLGVAGATVHRGRSVADPWSALVCFAGVGPGEVTVGGRKAVGIAQWRSRQGALFHSACYWRWDPAALLEVLSLPATVREQGAAVLAGAAVGLEELVGPTVPLESVVAAFLRRLPGPQWAVAIEDQLRSA